ncbi:hypothetical protein BH23VER1_BH23VER1_36190 [soil metagenome]
MAEAKRVLYLGDSLSMGAFGRTLDSELRNARHEVYTYVTGGATPYYWLSLYGPMNCSIGHWEKTPHSDVRRNVVKRVPKVEELLARHSPEVVIVQTGTNLYATLRSKRRSKEQNVREVVNLIENMCKTVVNSGAELYWIAPPDSHTGRYPRALQDEMLALTRSVVERYGFLFQSASVTRFTDPYPKTDGIHYGPTEAKAWGSHVATHFTDWAAGRVPRPDVAARQRVMVAAAAPPAELATEQAEPPRAIVVKVAVPDEAVPRAIPVAPPRAIPVGKMAPTLVASSSSLSFSPLTAIPAPAAPESWPVSPPAPEARNQSETDEPPGTTGAPGSEAPKHEVFVVRRAQLADGASDVVDVTMTLRTKSNLPHMSEVTYKSAFAIYEWEVIKVSRGSYPYNVIRVAHPVVWNGRRMGVADYEIGRTTSLKLKVLSAYPSLEQLQTIDDLPLALELPVYTASLD